MFDEESGEAMVGFDVQERNRRRNGLERQVSNMNAATRAVSGQGGGGGGVPPAADSNRRLSRELEEGFRDDSDDESDEGQVVVGRWSTSVRP